METNTHQIVDVFQHLWAYISGFFLTMIAALKLWWHDRKVTKRMVADNAQAIVLMNEKMVTHPDLQNCRDDVRAVDDENLEKIYDLIREGNKENHQQHIDLGAQILDTHKQIIALHEGRGS